MTRRWIKIKNLKMCGTVCFSSRRRERYYKLTYLLMIQTIQESQVLIQHSLCTNFFSDFCTLLLSFKVNIKLEQTQQLRTLINIITISQDHILQNIKKIMMNILFCLKLNDVITLYHLNFCSPDKNQRMSLHMKWLDFDFETTFHRSSKSPQLQQIIRDTKDHQIKQHENQFHLSPQRALIRTTKKILNINRTTNNSNLTITNFSDGLKEEKARTITSIKNRKEQKLSLAKKQLELLNEINLSLQNNKIRRYQEQILLEEAEIESTVAQHKIKRNRMTATPKGNKLRMRQETIKSPIISPSDRTQQLQEKKHKASIDSDGLFPSRRFIQRKKSKGRVSPWHSSSPFY